MTTDILFWSLNILRDVAAASWHRSAGIKKAGVTGFFLLLTVMIATGQGVSLSASCCLRHSSYEIVSFGSTGSAAFFGASIGITGGRVMSVTGSVGSTTFLPPQPAKQQTKILVARVLIILFDIRLLSMVAKLSGYNSKNSKIVIYSRRSLLCKRYSAHETT